MRIWAGIVTLVLGSLESAFAERVDENQPYVTACVTVLDSTRGEESWWFSHSVRRAHQRVQAHLEASVNAESVIAAFDHSSGKFIEGWRPQFVEIAAKKQVIVPKSPVAWNWSEESRPIDIQVLVFAPGSSDASELRKLIYAMDKGKNDAVARLQGTRLRELMGKVIAANAPADPDTATEHAALGNVSGVFRTIMPPPGIPHERREFEWRNHARKTNFSASRAGCLVFTNAD